jgi:acetamidase/formamidase
VGGLANPPFAGTAHMGKLKGEAKDKAAATAARTVPPREHGGNCDIKDLSRGSKVFFPVYVDGAGLSVGDLHFSQGDGEITFCGAIEMAGWVHMKVTLIKGGMAKYSILGTAPVQGHISGVVDVPNACATLWLPTEIFDFDINPTAAGPTTFLDGSIQMPISPDIIK